MLAEKFSHDKIKSFPVAAEEKLDGIRAIGIYGDGAVQLYSRNGNLLANYTHICEQLASLVDAKGWNAGRFFFDGEIIAGDFGATLSGKQRGNEQDTAAIYHVFELLNLELFEQYSGIPYSRRRWQVEAFFSAPGPWLSHVQAARVEYPDSWAALEALYDRTIGAGGEGLMVKPLDSGYTAIRSTVWLKMKEALTADVIIKGFAEGKGRLAGALGAMIVDVAGVDVRVSAGLTTRQREEIWDHQEQYSGRMVEVSYQELTKAGSLRHPVFVGFRDDKPTTDGIGA